MDSVDGFSVTALTSCCTSILANAASATAELEALPSDAHLDELLALAEGLVRIGDEVPSLEQAVGDATVISVRLQNLLRTTLTLGDAAVAKLHKQVMRVSCQNAHLLDQDYISRHVVLLTDFAEMSEFLAYILSLSTAAEQHTMQEADDEQKLLHGQTALSDCAQLHSILTESGPPNLSTSSYNEKSAPPPDEPPPYAPPTEPSTQASPAADGSSSFSSLFKAFTSHFTARPDPLASALCHAIDGDASSAQISGLLAQGASPNGRDEQGRTPLQCALAADNETLFTLLLAAGANPSGNSSSSTSWLGGGEMPPLFQAARDGKLRIAQALIDRGADARAESTMGQPWFYDVCGSGTATRQGVEFLLQHGASASSADLAGRPAVVLAAEAQGPRAATAAGMLALLLDRGASVDACTAMGTPLLVDAVHQNRMDVARLLLSRGARADVSDSMGQPLLISVLKNTKMAPDDKETLLRQLFSNGADANATDATWGNTALYHALESCSTTVIQLLLEHGARPDETVMADGVTPLLHAMDAGNTDVARLLVTHGADVNAADAKGRRPLMQAVLRGDAAMVRLLRGRGARVDEQGSVDVETVARAVGNKAMMEALGLKAEA
ncbi:hypothetical protein PWT90_04643 [Aphanocladium album]|nr:hypothetical protein PWT90_04643 [Aphanocladium album]